MNRQFEIILVGDKSIRDNTSKSLTENTKNNRILIDDSSCKINIHNLENINREQFELLKLKELTILVCIDPDNLELNKLIKEISHSINYIEFKAIHIIPLILDRPFPNFEPEKIYDQLRNNFCHICRKNILIDPHQLTANNYNAHLQTIFNTAFSGNIHVRLLGSSRLVSSLFNPNISHDSAAEKEYASRFRSGLNLISKTLKPSIIQPKGNPYLKPNDLKKLLNKIQHKLEKQFSDLKNMINTKGIPSEYYIRGIFLNIICTIAAILVALTRIEIPYVYNKLSQNLQNHNSYFKFYPTNNIDIDRLMLIEVEKEINCNLNEEDRGYTTVKFSQGAAR